MKKNIYYESCPNCGNEIDVPANPGEIRKCPFCRRRYVVKYEQRNRKYLEEYLKGTDNANKISEKMVASS